MTLMDQARGSSNSRAKQCEWSIASLFVLVGPIESVCMIQIKMERFWSTHLLPPILSSLPTPIVRLIHSGSNSIQNHKWPSVLCDNICVHTRVFWHFCIYIHNTHCSLSCVECALLDCWIVWCLNYFKCLVNWLIYDREANHVIVSYSNRSRKKNR